MTESSARITTTCHYYRVGRRQIGYLRFILEACEGLALLRTVDPVQGIVAFHIGPGCEAELDQLVSALKSDMRIEPLHYTESISI